MQGPIENALMIVAAGNAYLGGADIKGFWPDGPTFQFLKVCEFRKPPASGRDTDDYPLVASDPLDWFETLKPWSKGLRLHCVPRPRGPDQQIDTPDRMLVGFVGGGPRWLIEAVGQTDSEVWEGFHRLGDRDDPDKRVWMCTHVLQGTMPAAESEPTDLAVALSDLKMVLPEIEAFARAEKLDGFADCFARASEALQRRGGPKQPWAMEVARHTGFDAAQLNVLEAIKHAWVFGGMGSWNDVGGSGARYEDLSERLFNALNDCTAGLANSTYRGV